MISLGKLQLLLAASIIINIGMFSNSLIYDYIIIQTISEERYEKNS